MRSSPIRFADLKDWGSEVSIRNVQQGLKFCSGSTISWRELPSYRFGLKNALWGIYGGF